MLTLTPEELRELTGYVQPAAQLRALHALGFSRARRDRLGRVVLERGHYDAVIAARSTPEPTPTLRIPRLHLA
jgi:hypothetical protein